MTVANTDSATGDRGAATEREELLRALTLAFGRGHSPEEAQRLAEARLRASETEEAAYAERVAQRQREMAAAAPPELVTLSRGQGDRVAYGGAVRDLERGADQRRQGEQESPTLPPTGQRTPPQGARRQHSQSASTNGGRRQHGPSRAEVRQQERQEDGHVTNAALGAALRHVSREFKDLKGLPRGKARDKRQRQLFVVLSALMTAADTGKEWVALPVENLGERLGVDIPKTTGERHLADVMATLGWEGKPAKRMKRPDGRWDRYAARYRVVVTTAAQGEVGHGSGPWLTRGNGGEVGHGGGQHLSFGEGGSASPPRGSEAPPPGPQGQRARASSSSSGSSGSGSSGSTDPQRPLRGRKGRGSSASGPDRRPSANALDGQQDSLRESRNIRPIRPGQDDWFCCTQCPYEGTARANAGGYAVCPKCRKAMASSLDGWRHMAPPGTAAPASLRRTA